MTTPLHDPEPYAAHVLSGESVAVGKLRLQIARIAPHFRVALVTGEAGAGHQAVAKRLHLASPVADRGFVSVSTEELAGRGLQTPPHGTIYLQGIESLLPPAQGNLLRTIKVLDRETRVVVATRTSLKGMVSTGRLRNDLYEAIAMLEIHVAPLRERRDDLEMLATAMLRDHGSNPQFHPGALQRMKSHNWPGNLEELWRVCERLAALRRPIEAADLSWHKSAPLSSAETVRLDDVMYRHVMDVLEGCAGNKLRAAELLGISRSTLYRMLDSAAASELVR